MGRVQGLRLKIAGKSIPVEVRFGFCRLLVGICPGFRLGALELESERVSS